MKKIVILRSLKLIVSICLILTFLFTPHYVSVEAAKYKNDRVAPTAPKNLTVSTVDQTFVTLKWTASYDKKGVASYQIFQDSTYVASNNTTCCTIRNLALSTTYVFFIKAIDYNNHVSPSSNLLTVTTVNPDVPSENENPTTPEQPTIPSDTKIITGYYASWSAYSGYTPFSIPASKLTNIHYAFAKIGDDFKIALGDPTIDRDNFEKLYALKKTYPHLKTIISIGGWDWSGKFSDVALTNASRTTFADSVVAFIKQYHFDGVDIDWEYPVSGGLSTNMKRAEDEKNFTLLLQTIKEKLDTQGVIDGKKYSLSFAGGAGSTYIKNTELNLLYKYVDYAIIMTYDLHGPWDSYTDFNAPLYSPSETSPQYKLSVDSVVNAWISAGFSPSKIVLGVPFYGYVYKGATETNNGLYSRYTGGSSMTYDQIVSNYLYNLSYIQCRHAEALVPWLFNGSAFITYEDAASISAKAHYVNTNQLAGVSIWELSQNKNGDLLDALTSNLN